MEAVYVVQILSHVVFARNLPCLWTISVYTNSLMSANFEKIQKKNVDDVVVPYEGSWVRNIV